MHDEVACLALDLTAVYSAGFKTVVMRTEFRLPAIPNMPYKLVSHGCGEFLVTAVNAPLPILYWPLETRETEGHNLDY